MQINYNCKFCAKPGTVTIGDDPVEVEASKRFLPLLCCDRCGQFMERKRKITDAIQKGCVSLVSSRLTMGENSVKAMEGMIRSNLEELTKRYARLVCDYLRVDNVWQADFVEQLMEHPGKQHLITSGYFKGMRHLARQARKEPTHDRQTVPA